MDFYPADYTPPPWIEVHASVLRFDPEALRGRVTDTLARGGDDEALWEATRACVGPWFGLRGWWIGNESFGSCWCHSPLARRGRQKKPPSAAAVDWVVREVTLIVDAVRALEPLFARFRDQDLDHAVAGGLNALIDEMAERTHCNESWYRYVTESVPWLFDALGVRRGKALEALLARMTSCVFSSWVRPAPDAARAMALELAAYASTRGRRGRPIPTSTPATDDARGLVSRLLRPQRPQRAAAKAALEGVRTEDGVAALVARGLVPAAWSTDPPRFSALDPKTRILPPSPTPTRPLLVALGADPEGIAAALSRWTAYREALQLWTRTQRPGGVIWCDATLPTGWAARRCDRDNQPLEAALSWVEALCGVEVDTVGPPVALDGPTRAAMFEVSVGDAEALRDLCLETRAKAIRTLFPAQERLDLDFDTVARVWAADRVWEVLRALDLRYHHPPVAAALRRRGDAPRRWAARDGEALGSLTMPFAPLIALWGLGYPIRATRGPDDVLGVEPLAPP